MINLDQSTVVSSFDVTQLKKKKFKTCKKATSSELNKYFFMSSKHTVFCNLAVILQMNVL